MIRIYEYGHHDIFIYYTLVRKPNRDYTQMNESTRTCALPGRFLLQRCFCIVVGSLARVLQVGALGVYLRNVWNV